MAAASNITTDSLHEIFNNLQSLNSELCHLELQQCLRDVSTTNPSLFVNIRDAVHTARKIKNGLNTKDIILSMMSFGGAAYSVFELLSPGTGSLLGRIVNVVTAIFPFLFNTDGPIDEVMGRLKKVLDEDMKHECEGVKREILESVAYLKGVPPANKVMRRNRVLVLCGLGSNLTEKGSKQLGIITSKIMDMLKNPSIFKFDVFMEYVEVYCSLATLRELVLLYHFAVLSAYKAPNANCVKQVLDRHRAYDKSLCKVIRFLHKPRKDTLRLHLQCNAKNSEIVQNFLNKHELLEDPSRFYDKALQIFSEKDKNATLSLHTNLYGSIRIRCYKNTNMENTVFTFCKTSKETGNTFSIHPLPCSDRHVTSGWWLTSRNGEPSEKGKWRLVEMEPDAPDQPSAFVIVLDSTEDQCLYTDNKGYVYVKSFHDSDSGYFWTLTVL